MSESPNPEENALGHAEEVPEDRFREDSERSFLPIDTPGVEPNPHLSRLEL